MKLQDCASFICETLQDYYDPCPVNEQLRAKVLTRLIKEGSNANDPTIIALSDYSRLENLRSAKSASV